MSTEQHCKHTFLSLSHNTPMQSFASDHNLVIKDGIIFYNMMMQCRWNQEKKRYNNGFGLTESDASYQQRIRLTVQLLAECLALNPAIYIIGLAEAPIRPEDIALFIHECSRYPSLKRFMSSLKPNIFSSLGVATFFDADYFQISSLDLELLYQHFPVRDRIQGFELITKENDYFILYNLHLPYDIAKSNNNQMLIEFSKILFQSQTNKPVIVIGDFNLHPNIISSKLESVTSFVQEKNNLLSRTNASGKVTSIQFDTVDGILKSANTKTRSHSINNASHLKWSGVDLRREYRLAKELIRSGFNFFTNKRNLNLIESLSVYRQTKLALC